MIYTHKVLGQTIRCDLISALAYHDLAVGLEAACTLHLTIRCLEVKVEQEAMTPRLLQVHDTIPSDLAARHETIEEVADSQEVEALVEALVEEASADLEDGRRIRLADSAMVILSEPA
jgi:hypothetical protein